MIQPLRQRHRRLFIALAVLLPILFLWGLSSRKAIPLMSSGAAKANSTEVSP